MAKMSLYRYENITQTSLVQKNPLIDTSSRQIAISAQTPEVVPLEVTTYTSEHDQSLLGNLPKELLLLIFSKLNFSQLAKFLLVNKKFQKISKEEILKSLQSFLEKDPHFKNQHVSSLTPDQLHSFNQLHLNSKKIEEVPGSICLLKNLTSIEFIGNHIKTLPKEMVHLKKLTHINIEHNHIDTFPDVLTKMDQLKTIMVRDNPLTSIPREMKEKVTSCNPSTKFASKDTDPSLI